MLIINLFDKNERLKNTYKVNFLCILYLILFFNLKYSKTIHHEQMNMRRYIAFSEPTHTIKTHACFYNFTSEILKY